MKNALYVWNPSPIGCHLLMTTRGRRRICLPAKHMQCADSAMRVTKQAQTTDAHCAEPPVRVYMQLMVMHEQHMEPLEVGQGCGVGGRG